MGGAASFWAPWGTQAVVTVVQVTYTYSDAASAEEPMSKPNR